MEQRSLVIGTCHKVQIGLNIRVNIKTISNHLERVNRFVIKNN